MVIDHRSGLLQPLRSSLSVMTYPLYLAADAPSQISAWLGGKLQSQQSLLEQNRDLQEEILLLQARQQKLQSLEEENLRLRNLLDSSFKIGERVLIAELTAVELDPYRHQVVISKGATSGVFAGQPVLDAQAVMGQVVTTSALHATVVLITDTSHALPVQVLRNGLRTVAVGTGEINRLSLPYLAGNADIQEGDVLVTSGLGGIFPPGYPVARVTRITQEPGQHFASIDATPMAHLDRSREVLLVWKIENTIELPNPAEETAADTTATAGTDESEANAAADKPSRGAPR